MWEFFLHSLFREYGWDFFRRVAVPHPVRTARAVLRSGVLDFSGDMTAISDEAPSRGLEGTGAIVGVGFCLKPMNVPCPSGRPNHDCHYLENLLQSTASDAPVPCRQCAVGEFGIMTLRTGGAFYIMTSARDILLDVFAPALDDGAFTSGLFVLCRYSLRPFAVGLLASGMQGWMFPFARGDCQDYQTWLQADRGVKEEQTEIDKPTQERIRELLRGAAQKPSTATQFERRGNVLYGRIGAGELHERTEAAESQDCIGNRTG